MPSTDIDGSVIVILLTAEVRWIDNNNTRKETMKLRDWIEMLSGMDPESEAWCMYQTKTGCVCNAPPTPTGIVIRPPPPTETPPEPTPEPTPKPPADSEEKEQAHQIRAHSLAMLRDVQHVLVAMVQTEQIDNLPAALMACHYVLMELNLDLAMRTGEIVDPIQVLRDLFEAGGLEDHFYRVRESEEAGWEGPRTVKWGRACEAARKLMNP